MRDTLITNPWLADNCVRPRPEIVGKAKLTPAELSALVAEAGSWLRQQREKFYPQGIPLSNSHRTQLEPFFAAEILDTVRIVNLAQIGEAMPSPPFFQKLLAAGPLMLPKSAHTAAVPFIDVAVFQGEPSLRVGVSPRVLRRTRRCKLNSESCSWEPVFLTSPSKGSI